MAFVAKNFKVRAMPSPAERKALEEFCILHGACRHGEAFSGRPVWEVPASDGDKAECLNAVKGAYIETHPEMLVRFHVVKEPVSSMHVDLKTRKLIYPVYWTLSLRGK